MGQATTVVAHYLRDALKARIDLVIIRDELWGDNGLRYLEFVHDEAPEGRHVDTIWDFRGLRFKPEADV